MLSDEERVLKNIKYIIKQNYVDTEDDIIGILISASNLIKKQSKEIEELKRVDISNSQIIANMSTRHFNDREKIRKYESLVDKIKAKIEELEKGNKNTFIRGEKILVLQSLLEKE